MYKTQKLCSTFSRKRPKPISDGRRSKGTARRGPGRDRETHASPVERRGHPLPSLQASECYTRDFAGVERLVIGYYVRLSESWI